MQKSKENLEKTIERLKADQSEKEKALKQNISVLTEYNQELTIQVKNLKQALGSSSKEGKSTQVTVESDDFGDDFGDDLDDEENEPTEDIPHLKEKLEEKDKEIVCRLFSLILLLLLLLF